MSSLDIATALVFSLLVFSLGLSFVRYGGNAKSFFAAGGQVPWWISGTSVFMSFFSVGTFVVWGSIAYKHGLVAVTIQTTMSIAGFLVGFFIAPKWNKTSATTAAEFVSDRLGYNTQKYYTFIFLCTAIFYAGAALYPVGKIIEVTTGVPLATSILMLGLLIIIYTTLGGLWAVLVTDVLQFVVLSAAVVIVIPLAFSHIGGVSNFFQHAPEGFFALTTSEYSWWFIAAFCFYNMVFIGGQWAYVQRYTSVASPEDAKKVGWLFGGLYLIAPLVWMLPPMIYRIIDPGLAGNEAEGAYMLISQTVVPNGFMGLILGAMVFATASSTNTFLNIKAGIFTNDIYKHFRPNISDFETMLVARGSTIVFGIVTVVIALMIESIGGIVEVIFSLAAMTGVALYLPPIWAMFSKTLTGAKALLVSCLSLLVNFFFKFLTPALIDFSLNRAEEMAVGVIVPVIILVAMELQSRRSNAESEQYRAYIKMRASKEGDEHEIASRQEALAANRFARKIIGIGMVCVGLVLMLLAFMADKAQVFIASVGVLIVLSAYVVIDKSTWKKGGAGSDAKPPFDSTKV